MSFDAGSIESRATLDTTEWFASVTKLRAEGRKLAGERFSPKVGADTGEGDAKILRFRQRITEATRPASVRLTVDNARALLALEPVAERLDDMRNRITTARVDASTQKAKDKLDDLDLRLRSIGRIVSKPRVSVEGVETAKLQLDRLELQLARLNRERINPGGRGGGGGALGGLASHAPGGFGLAIGAGLPIIAPVAGLAAGAVSSLLTPTVAGGIGGGLFAKTASSSYQTLSTDLKNLTTLQKRYNSATTNKTRLAALNAEKKAWAALSPEERKAATNLHGLDATWTGFQKKLQPQSFKLLATGTDIARKGLKLLTPDVKAAGNTIDHLAASADKALGDPFWKQFFGDFLPNETHRALHTLGTDLGLVLTGLGHLSEKFAPLGHDLERDMTHLATQFDRWTQGAGPGRFVDWVQKNGPSVVKDIEGIGRGIGGIAKGLSPIGTVELDALGGIGNFLGDVAADDPKLITALGVAFLSVAGGLKAIAAVKGITEILGAIKGVRSGGIKGIVGSAAGGMGPCCCGPGGGGGPVGGGGKTVSEGETAGKEAGGSSAARSLLTKLGIRTGSAAGDLAVGTLVVAPIIRAVLPGSIPDPLLSDQAYRVAHSTGAQHKIAAQQLGMIGNSGFPQDQGNINAIVANVQKYGSPQQLADLQKLAGQYHTVAVALGDVVSLQDSAANAINNYKAGLEAAGTPISKINGLVATYAHTLKGIPPNVITKVVAQSSAAEAALRRLLALRQQLKGDVAMHVITASTAGKLGSGQLLHSMGGPIYGPGTATSDSIPARLSTGEFVMRASAVRHYGVGTLAAMNWYAGGGPVLPPWYAAGQHPSPNVSTSSSSRAPSRTAVGNVLAGIINFAGLSFLSDLKSTEHAIRSGITQMIDRLNNAVRDKYLSSDAMLVKELRAAQGPLVALAQQELVVGKSLSAAQTTLSNLRSQAASTRSGTLSNYQGLGDLSQMPNVNSVGGFISVLHQQDKLGRSFSRNLGILRKKGLSKTEYDQLESQGPGAVGSIVALLATASRGQIHTINSETGLLSGLGRSTGAASAQFLFGGRIAAAKATVTADRALLHALRGDQRRIADLLEKLITNGLNDHETHRLLKELGAEIRQSSHDTGHAVGAALNGGAHHAHAVRRVTPYSAAKF